MQQPLAQVLMYPLADFDGAMKSIDWKGLPHLPAKAPTGRGETKWVFPETFFDVLADGPSLPARRRAMLRCSPCLISARIAAGAKER